eukprot:6492709-Amphidinium_carterae.3
MTLPDEHTTKVRKTSVKKSRRVGGGTFRAYIHRECHGQKGKANFGELARKYRESRAKLDPGLIATGKLAAKYAAS